MNLLIFIIKLFTIYLVVKLAIIHSINSNVNNFKYKIRGFVRRDISEFLWEKNNKKL